MSLLDLFRIKQPAPLPGEAVTVELRGPVLRVDGKLTRETDEFSALQDTLIDAVEQAGVGVFDCNEVETDSAKLFFYSEDGERLAAHLQPLLQSSPVGTHARLVIRSGGPDGPQRIVQL